METDLEAKSSMQHHSSSKEKPAQHKQHCKLICRNQRSPYSPKLRTVKRGMKSPAHIKVILGQALLDLAGLRMARLVVGLALPRLLSLLPRPPHTATFRCYLKMCLRTAGKLDINILECNGKRGEAPLVDNDSKELYGAMLSSFPVLCADKERRAGLVGVGRPRPECESSYGKCTLQACRRQAPAASS